MLKLFNLVQRIQQPIPKLWCFNFKNLNFAVRASSDVNKTIASSVICQFLKSRLRGDLCIDVAKVCFEQFSDFFADIASFNMNSCSGVKNSKGKNEDKTPSPVAKAERVGLHL